MRVSGSHSGCIVPLIVAGTLVLPASAAGASRPIADVRADLNHDGLVSMRSPADKRPEDSRRAAAIVLPNLDDDARRCPTTRLGRFSDRELAACNDAADSVVDGRSDLADMAPLRVRRWRGAPAGTRARIAVRGSLPRRARLFVRRGTAWRSLGTGGALTVGE